MTATVTIKLLNGDLLTVCGDEWMTGEALYREVYTSLSPDVAPPPLEAWRLMLLRDETYIAPSSARAGLTDGEVLDLWIESGTYQVHVACYGAVTGFLRMRLEIRGSVEVNEVFYMNDDTGRWFYPYEVLVDGDISCRAQKGCRGRYDYRYLAQRVGVNRCVEEYVFAWLFCQFYDTLPAHADIAPLPFVRSLIETTMLID